MDLNCRNCWGEQSPIARHNSSNKSHWLYSAFAKERPIPSLCEARVCASECVKSKLRKGKVCICEFLKLLWGVCTRQSTNSPACVQVRVPQLLKCYWQNKDTILDLSLLVWFRTETGEDGVIWQLQWCWCVSHSYGCPDSCPPRWRTNGLAQLSLLSRPGMKAAEWSRYVGHCLRGLGCSYRVKDWKT